MMARVVNVEELILELYGCNAVKFGNFMLKSGISSPIYFDLRVIVSFPKIMKKVSSLMWKAAEDNGVTYKSICGVPYTALPIATLMAFEKEVPMLIRRKETKSYGTKKTIEGLFEKGDTCLIIEDTVTSGSSVLETFQALAAENLSVHDAIVLLDREQGGSENLLKHNIKLHSICTMTNLLQILLKHEKITSETVEKVSAFIAANKSVSVLPDPIGDQTSLCKVETFKTLTYEDRINLCSHPVSKKLFSIMATKRTNLCLATDVTSCSELLQLAEKVGPYICILKTHVDILEDFTPEFTKLLMASAHKHQFLIFEDRKFSDIGNTAKLQYCGGLYRISEFADIINAHPLPGPGVLDGLKEVGGAKERGCLLVAQMSSAGCLIDEQYTKATVEMAVKSSDFVIGFVAQSRLTQDSRFVHLTPGIQLTEGCDSLGQQYITPHMAVVKRGSDVIIVGRGIIKASDVVAEARRYQQAGYAAYEESLQR